MISIPLLDKILKKAEEHNIELRAIRISLKGDIIQFKIYRQSYEIDDKTDLEKWFTEYKEALSQFLSEKS